MRENKDQKTPKADTFHAMKSLVKFVNIAKVDGKIVKLFKLVLSALRILQ